MAHTPNTCTICTHIHTSTHAHTDTDIDRYIYHVCIQVFGTFAHILSVHVGRSTNFT